MYQKYDCHIMDMCTGTIKMTSTYYVRENYPTSDQRLHFCEWCVHNGCTEGKKVTIETESYGCCGCQNDHPRMCRYVCLNHSKTTIFSVFRGQCSICKKVVPHEKLTVCDQCSVTNKVCIVCGSRNAKPCIEYYKVENVTECNFETLRTF